MKHGILIGKMYRYVDRFAHTLSDTRTYAPTVLLIVDVCIARKSPVMAGRDTRVFETGYTKRRGKCERE